MFENIFKLFRSKRGQATTEVVLLFPIFFILALFIIKVYGLLIVLQKAEIASAYAGRRWQLESHRAVKYTQSWDKNFLIPSIKKQVQEYIGYNNPAMRKFLSLRKVEVDIKRYEVWNTITITVATYPPRIPLLCNYDKREICKSPYGQACMRGYNFICETGGTIQVVKQVPNRDRPIGFILPNSKALK